MVAATTNTHANQAERPSPFARFDAFFTNLARARACATAYEQLASLSDTQLAARGLKRTDLSDYVVRTYL